MGLEVGDRRNRAARSRFLATKKRADFTPRSSPKRTYTVTWSARFPSKLARRTILFLTPIVVLVFILDKAFDLARRALKPVTAIIPDRLVSGAPTEAILAIVLIALLCFLAGLFARTRPAQRIVAELESSVLSKVPAYEYLKQAGASVMGLGETADHPVVFAQLGGAWRIAVQTGVVGGGMIAVFVPNSPNPMSGSVFLVAADSVRPASVPLAAAMACLRRCGAGSEVFQSELTPNVPQAGE